MPKETRKTSRQRLKSAPPGADDRLARLAAIAEVRAGRWPSHGAAKLLAAGAARMAHKLIEEAAETGIEAVRGDQAVVVTERVDHREALLRMAESSPSRPTLRSVRPRQSRASSLKDGGAWASR